MAEPKPKVKLPKCPSELSPAARKGWRALGAKLVAIGLMTEGDEAALFLVADAYAEVRELAKLVRGKPRLVMVAGQQIPDPERALLAKEREFLRKMLVEFGLTPAARSRVTTAHAEPEVDEVSEFLNQGRRAAG